MFLFKGELEDVTVVRVLPSHQSVPALFPGPICVCGLSLLLVLYNALRGFFPGSPVFASIQKPTFPNFNLMMECTDVSE